MCMDAWHLKWLTSRLSEGSHGAPQSAKSGAEIDMCDHDDRSRENCPADKHQAFTQCWFNVGPPSPTVAQHLTSIGFIFSCLQLSPVISSSGPHSVIDFLRLLGSRVMSTSGIRAILHQSEFTSC